MAYESIQSSQLRLVFFYGPDEETGEPIYETKNFNNIDPEASASELLKVAEAFEKLQELPLGKVQRRDLSTLTK